MTVEETMSNILCNPSVKLLSAYDGKVISPVFNTRHKDYDFIKDMEISSFCAKIETSSNMQDYARIVYCIYLHYGDVTKIAEHRKAEKQSAHKRSVEKAKKKLEDEPREA